MLPLSTKEFQTSATHTSLETNKANNEGNNTHNRLSPHHLSFQESTFRPLPTVKEHLELMILQSFLIVFHNLTPYPSFTPSFPPIPQITWARNATKVGLSSKKKWRIAHWQETPSRWHEGKSWIVFFQLKININRLENTKIGLERKEDSGNQGWKSYWSQPSCIHLSHDQYKTDN